MRDAGSPGRSCREIPAPILQPVRVADRPSDHLFAPRPKCSFSTGRAPRAEKKGAARSPSARGSGRSSRQTRKPRRQAVTTDPFGSHFRASKEAVHCWCLSGHTCPEPPWCCPEVARVANESLWRWGSILAHLSGLDWSVWRTGNNPCTY